MKLPRLHRGQRILQAVLLCGGLTPGVGWWWQEARERAAERKLQVLASQDMGGTGVDTASLQAERFQWSEQRIRWEALSQRWDAALAAPVRDEEVEAIPFNRAEAFFAVARRVESFRRVLVTAGVEVREDERFGFAAYQVAGPSDRTIAVVAQQLDCAALLVDAVRAEPANAFIGMEREMPGVESGERSGVGDYFVPDPRLRITLPESTPHSIYRVAFVGRTGTLRAFVTRLARSAPDAYIRLVEVMPYTEEGIPTLIDRRIPTSESALRRFAVTVEFIVWPVSPDKPDGVRS